jgi:hypothetical protein
MYTININSLVLSSPVGEFEDNDMLSKHCIPTILEEENLNHFPTVFCLIYFFYFFVNNFRCYSYFVID